MVINRQMTALRVGFLLCLAGVKPVWAQVASYYDDGFGEVSYVDVLCGDYRGIEVLVEVKERASEEGWLGEYEIRESFRRQASDYDWVQSDLALLGVSHTDFSEMEYEMEEFYYYYRDGGLLAQAELVELANLNTVTAADINRDFTSWQESDYYLSSYHQVEIIEVSSIEEPELITVGGVEPVPEPSASLLFFLSSFLLLQRRR